MGSPLIEDFSDAVAFVQEDTSYVEQSASDDEVERKIEEEHAKYKEALAKRQEEVRASRPWSAPPVESPRPEQQKEREKERQARGSLGDVDLDAPRAEYEPPARPYLLQAQASGNNLSYLSRPQSAEHRTAAAARMATQSRASLSGIEEETGEGTACDSRQPSEMGRLGSTFGEGDGAAGTGADDVLDRDQYGNTKAEELREDAEGEVAAAAEEDSPLPGDSEQAERHGDGDDGVGEEATGAMPQPSAEEVAEDEAGDFGDGDADADGGGDDVDVDGNGRGATAEASGGGGADDAEPVDDGVLMASREGLGASLGPDDFLRQSAQQDSRRSSRGSAAGEDGPRGKSGGEWGEEQQDEDEEGANGGGGGGDDDAQEEEQEDQEDARSAVQAAPSEAGSASTHSMAMRGFVEPLPYDQSYGSAGRRSPAVGRRPADQELSTQAEGDEGEYDDYGEDTFEDDEEEEEEQEEGGEGGPSVEPQASVSAEGSGLLRASPSASRALRASSSIRSRSGSGMLPPPSKEASRALSSSSASARRPSGQLTPLTVRASAVGPDEEEGAEKDDDVVALAPPPPQPLSTLPPIFKSIPSVTGSGIAGVDVEAMSSRTPLAASNSQRSVSSSGAGIPTSSAAAPQPQPLSELQPSQQFALQLLKHDIEVLPQHHKAAAEAAVARRKSAAARPAGAGLAAFGYLGYHLVSDDLTAPTGPAFRSTSPGRSGSPGRGESGTALVNSSSLKAVRSVGPVDSAVAARSGGRPTSAPHMRPTSATLEPAGGSGPGGADGDGADAVQGGAAGFVGLAREMRAGSLLPPVAPRATRSNSGSAGGASVSVMEESELNAAVAQSRMKFDIWLDALSNGRPGSAVSTPPPPVAAAAAKGGAGPVDPDRVGAGVVAAGGPSSRRPPRPMTAPASGRRRPVSARPGGGAGLYLQSQAVVAVPKPLMRPMSAQTHSLRPASAVMVRGSTPGAGYFDTSPADPPVPVTIQPPDAPPAAGGTAAVEVGGVTVSVYVADTLKRIVEANRWLQQLGVTTKRYRLKDRLSNMTIQLVEELPPLPSDYNAGGHGDIGAVAIVKELSLKQFLSGHAKLKQQAKKLRQAAAFALQQQPQQQQRQTASFAVSGGTGMYGGTQEYGGGGSGGGRGNRPFSATFGSGGGGGGGGGNFGNAPTSNGGRVRPASAVPYSGGRATGISAFGADPSLYGTVGAGGTGGGTFPAGRPVRPSSANLAYGRTPAFTSYNSGTSPPGVSGSPFLHTAYAAQAMAGGAVPGGKAPGQPGPRAAWGSSGGSGGGAYGSYEGYAGAGGRGSSGGGGGGGNGLPYMHRSISAVARSPGPDGLDPDQPDRHMDDDNDSERPLVVEPDERGDVSRAVQQKLGSASDYCQTRRQEIARLRKLPLA